MESIVDNAGLVYHLGLLRIMSFPKFRTLNAKTGEEEEELFVQSHSILCDPIDCSSPEDHPNPGTEPGCPALQADSLLFELQGSP